MSEEEESQWSRLPNDILNTIVSCLNNDADVDTYTLSTPIIHRLLLRSVCNSWRSSISPPSNPPTIILPFPFAPSPSLNPNRRGHFTLSLNTIYLLQQPPLQQSSSTIPKYWLLRVENGKTPNKWRPLNPISGVLTSNSGGLREVLPKSINLLNFRIYQIATSYRLDFVDCRETHIGVELKDVKYIYPEKVVMSNSWPLVAMAISKFKLTYVAIGDEKWRAVDDSNYDDMIFHGGKFYAVDSKGKTVSFSESNLKASEIVARFQLHGNVLRFKRFVECNGELFLIDRYFDPGEDMWNYEEIDKSVHLKIYRLNEEKGEWEGVNDLGDHVFFVGNDCSFSIVASDYPGLKPNCVYFCDELFHYVNVDEKEIGVFVGDVGVYCLSDGKYGALANFPDHWFLFGPPPSWLDPKTL